jgi:hypothetical protein
MRIRGRRRRREGKEIRREINFRRSSLRRWRRNL